MASAGWRTAMAGVKDPLGLGLCHQRPACAAGRANGHGRACQLEGTLHHHWREQAAACCCLPAHPQRKQAPASLAPPRHRVRVLRLASCTTRRGLCVLQAWPVYNAVLTALTDSAQYATTPASAEERQATLNKLSIAVGAAFFLPQVCLGIRALKSTLNRQC